MINENFQEMFWTTLNMDIICMIVLQYDVFTYDVSL